MYQYQTTQPILGSFYWMMYGLPDLWVNLPGQCVYLFTGLRNGPLNPKSVIGDIIVPTFPGYGHFCFQPDSTTTTLDPSGNFVSLNGFCHWKCTADVADGGQNVLGYFMDDGLGALLVGEYFPEPVPIVKAGDCINLRFSWAVTLRPVLR